MVDVFISYSSDDGAETARHIHDALERAGLTVWLDSLDALTGRPYDALVSAGSMIVIVSPESTKSQVVRQEILLAVELGKRIIPVRIGEASVPLMLRHLPAYELHEFDRLVAELVALVSESPEELSEPEPELDEFSFLDDFAEQEKPIDDLLVPPQPAAPPAPPAPAPAQPIPAAATPAPVQRREPSRERAAYSTPGEAIQPPHFTAYYPASVRLSFPYVLMVFVHLESARPQVEQIAQGYAPMMDGSPRSTAAISAIQVDVGSLITFVPLVEGITFDAAERVVTWQPPYQSATFLFTTPEKLPDTLTGRVLVYQGPLIIGEIPVSMQVVAADQPVLNAPDASTEMERLQPVFASYSHRDTPVMEYFRRSYARLGQKLLVDVYDLRSGEHWADRLLDMIGESAVFQLFWSQHSAQSQYCRQEWEHALRYLAERPRFIRPVWWQEPMPAPPPELAGLHFQRVPIPVLTQMQVLVAKLRGLLR